MNSQRGSIWAWAIGAGIVVFIVLWWVFHMHHWGAVALGILAAVLAVAMSFIGFGGSAQAPAKPQPAAAAPAARTASPAPVPKATAPEPEPDTTDKNDEVLSAVSDKLKSGETAVTPPPEPAAAEDEPAPEAEVSPAAQPLMSAAKPAAKAKRAPAARTASKPRSGDTRTEPRAKPAKAPAARSAKVVAPEAPAAPKAEAKPKAAKAAAPAKPDDLKKIKGIGPVIEKVLHGAGVTTFAQIAKWKKADIERFDAAINGPARIEHEDWVGQAKALAKPKKTET